MSNWSVTNRLTGEIVYAYEADTPTEWLGMEYAQFNHIKDPDPVPTPVVRRLSRLDFIKRLGDAAFVTILALAKDSVEVEALVEMVRMATPEQDGTCIDLDDPRTQYGIHQIEPTLIAMGKVSEGWADSVFA